MFIINIKVTLEVQLIQLCQMPAEISDVTDCNLEIISISQLNFSKVNCIFKIFLFIINMC